MSDDVITRAKAEYAGFGEHFPNDLAADLIALAESQAAEIDRLRHNRDYWVKAAKHHGDCICDLNPATTDGPQEFCPEHGRPYSDLLDGIESQARQLADIREVVEKLVNAENLMVPAGSSKLAVIRVRYENVILAILDGGN